MEIVLLIGGVVRVERASLQRTDILIQHEEDDGVSKPSSIAHLLAFGVDRAFGRQVRWIRSLRCGSST